MSDQMTGAAEMLWVVLANVSGGDWTQQSPAWQEAAARWRDNYFAIVHQERTRKPWCQMCGIDLEGLYCDACNKTLAAVDEPSTPDDRESFFADIGRPLDDGLRFAPPGGSQGGSHD